MNFIKYKTLMFFLALCLNVTVSAQSSYPALEKNIKLKQYTQAYQQALKLRAQNEGDPRFDYLYGFSALQTGHYNEAVFALDRVTVATPNVIRPRLELARAYLKLNNKTAALKEFNDVLSLSPPPNVIRNVASYIYLLNKGGSQAPKTVIKQLAAFSIGYDTNINFGTNNSEIDLPGFGLVTLNESVVKQASGFAEAKFQIMRQTVSSKTRNSFMLANLRHRKYFKKTDFDFTDLDLRSGFSINRNNKQYQFIARDRPVFLDGNLYSNTFGIDTILKNKLGVGMVLNTSLSVENYDNKKSPLTDRKRALLGVKLDQVIGQIQHQYNIYLGKEFADKKAGKQFSRNIIGLGYKGSYKWSPSNISFISLGYKNYKHQAAYPVFPNKREDDRLTASIIHERQVTDKATLVFSASHTNNKSNLDLYDAKKNEVKIGIRYEWD